MIGKPNFLKKVLTLPGIRVNDRNKLCQTAIDIACDRDDYECFEILCDDPRVELKLDHDRTICKNWVCQMWKYPSFSDELGAALLLNKNHRFLRKAA